jgi:F-type H+-transporting ATPase subunit a
MCLSPLDQFGEDEASRTFVQNVISKVWIPGSIMSYLPHELVELVYGVLDPAFFEGLLTGFLSNYAIDDEDAEDSEWEDEDMSITSLHSMLFISNLIGMIPGVGTITSDATFTFFLSFSTIISIILFGFTLHSARFFAIIYPSGTPIVMAPFIILIELVSYLARAISLGMRLYANMFAGHSLVKILMSFTWLFLMSALPFISVIVFGLVCVIFFMEIGIAYLQAYVFAALSSMYMEDAIALGH